ncbi:glycosyltransferase [Nocardioides jejuensis]|uniref:Glycosyltransferase family 1 protein n=1 Tax=Nocardioides jejuensis TaxID=2502782 RepID=A0A4R1CGA9_9ACTN|nr:glycosyltransferase [Nocardioides jejuensis]TCJ30169.1 glycosyltransferase family 1 protein [Nocardioides jejuensis]
MHVLFDAVAARTGSAAIVVGHLIRGWREAYPDDRLTVLTGPDGPDFEVAEGALLHRVTPPVPGPPGQLWLRSQAVRRTARELGVDAVVSGVPASGLFGSKAPRGVILYDLRHELRPEQFSAKTRAARRLSWWWSIRRADGVYTISERTLDDFRDRHPRLAHKGVAAQLGSDHAEAWRRSGDAAPSPDERPYALAFGHFGNKNAHAVIRAWQPFSAVHPEWTLRLVGMGSSDRASATQLVHELDLGNHVELAPWLDDDAFAATFAGASMVVFPSDFEGYGLPAAEAMRLGIPVVVSPDAALKEVTGGHAAVARSVGAEDLAAAMQEALTYDEAHLAAGVEFARRFTWARTARTVRDHLLPAT